MPLSTFWQAILNLIYPKRCLGCALLLPFDCREPLCSPCRNSIAPVSEPLCRTCGLHLPDGGMLCYACRKEKRAFLLARSAVPFEGAMKELIHAMKYKGRDDLAAPLSLTLYSAWQRYPELQEADALLAVPLHPARLRERGYNQSLLLAQHLLSRIEERQGEGGKPELLKDVLLRRRATQTQTELPRQERGPNVQGAFSVADPARVRRKRLLLIDDVCTTAATLHECALVLKAAGAAEVCALTLARD